MSELKPFPILSVDEAPHTLMPGRGYVVTANNRHWPADAKLNEGRAYSISFRAHRIEELLTGTPRHDLDSLRRIQCDLQSQDGRYLRTELIRALHNATEKQGGLSPRDLKAIELLLAWDLESPLECHACGIFDRWMQRIASETKLTPEALYHLFQAMPGIGVAQLNESILKAFHEALDDLKMGHDGQVRSWGELHRDSFGHLTGDARFLNASIPTPGMDTSVNPGTSHWDAASGLFAQYQGASQRLIVEMTSPPTLHSIVPGTELDLSHPGISDPQSPWMKWAGCELERREFPIEWSKVPLESVTL